MKLFISRNFRLRRYSLSLLLLLLTTFLLFSSACQKKIEYFDYVSELRNNLFLVRTEEFSLKIYSVVKESPYCADGVAQPSAPRFEAYLVAPSGDKTTSISFFANGKEYGGEMSYDNVRGQYFYACTLDASSLSQVDCNLLYGEREVTLTAKSVLTEKTLSPTAILERLQTECPQVFSALTDEYGFAGEIYLRLLYEDSPFYYVGVIDREGNIQAFLLNAETGKILARR